MFITNRSRRGVTVAELVVALALVSVMSIVVISFIMLMNSRTKANAANDTVIQDRQIIKAGVEAWLENSLADGAAFSLQADNKSVCSQYDGVENSCTLVFEDGVLQGTYPNGEPLTIRTKSVSDITFQLMMADGSKDFLLFCTVIGGEEDLGKKTSYTFCVNPHEGENGGVFE